MCGMATSKNGLFTVCNYYPPGNWTNDGAFENNVLPQGSLLTENVRFIENGNAKRRVGAGFMEVDANGDGKLSKKEVITLLTKYGNVKRTKQLAEKIFQKFDSNHDGYLD